MSRINYEKVQKAVERYTGTKARREFHEPISIWSGYQNQVRTPSILPMKSKGYASGKGSDGIRFSSMSTL